MAYEHKSGIQNAYDRAEAHPEWQSLVFTDKFVQSAELTEMQTVIRGRHNRVGRLIAKDGDRTEGAAAVVVPEAVEEPTVAQVILTAGKIYVGGDVLPVAALVLDEVPLTGIVEIGVRLTTTYIDSEDDPSLLGLVDGSVSQGEPGAAREVATIAWALRTDNGDGEFIPVYVMQDGTIIDQTPPPSLDGINAVVGAYDRGAHGSYIVNGCRVTALGKVDNAQVFSIEEGEANINGFKRTRLNALRVTHVEDFDTEEVAGEPHTWPGGTSVTFAVNRKPIATINSVLVTKEVTATVTRGSVANGADALPNNSVSAIIEVKQGGTTYVAGTSYNRNGDTVDWSPAGPEPATSSSYTVKYQYLALVTPDSSTDTSITVSGGVTGTLVVLGYDFKLPRIDQLCLNQNGFAEYIKGVSARDNPLPPIVPANLLPLAEINNAWSGKPSVTNSGIRSVPYAEMWRIFNRVFDHERLLQLERLKSGIDQREPTAKKGLFVDPFTSDFYRDIGEPQTAAIGDGVMQLAITPTFYTTTLTAPVMLDWVEEVIIGRELSTGCMKINPYQNFVPMPAAMTLTPAVDFWVEQQTQWASPQTLEFNRGVRSDNGPLVVSATSTNVVDNREEQADFLRPIAVAFKIDGMGAGEVLKTLTFDGVNVKPAGTQTANSAGIITGTFNIPSNMPAGTKKIVAEGMGGTMAYASFTGAGVIEISVMRQTTTVERWTRPAVTQRATSSPNWNSGNNSNNGSGGASKSDPLAQTFTPIEPRQVVGVDVKLCALGSAANSLLVHQVTVETGFPTEEVYAEAFVPMTGVALGWKSARYSLPVLTMDDRASAIVVKTDDPNHSLSIASLGAFDAAKQSYVGQQPYTTGVLLSSSNAQTWNAHQNDDLTFRLVAAKYTTLTKVVPLGSFAIVNASDLQVRADVEIPSADCSVVFEVVRANGDVIQLMPYQVVQLAEFVTETVQLRSVLKGTEKLSPILFAPVLFLAGTIAASGTYICRAFDLGTAVKLTSYFKAKLPAGSTVTMHYDKADDNWLAMPLITTEQLSDAAWVERKQEATAITATQGRIKITITGGPAARPMIGDLGAAIM